MAQSFYESLQINLLALLCFDGEHAMTIRQLATVDRFERPYQPIVQAAYTYLDRHQQPPKEHIDELIETQLNGEDGRFYEETLIKLYDIYDRLNVDHILDKLTIFLNHQALRDTVATIGPLLTASDPTESQVDTIYTELTKTLGQRRQTFDAGLFFGDPQLLTKTDRDSSEIFKTGIDELDRIELGPARQELWLLIAAAGQGKSWGLVHLGKQTLVRGYRVCHVTLEMSEKLVARRYLQSYFSASRRTADTMITVLDLDDRGWVEGIGTRFYQPRLRMDDPTSVAAIKNRLTREHKRLNRLVIKGFKTGSLTVGELSAYLNLMEKAHNFIPDLLLIDYVDLMKIGTQQYRQDLGRLFIDIRGMAQERNLAVATVTQSNRGGARSNMVETTDVAEDWSKVMTADIILTYTQSAAERRLKLGRLLVGKARNEESGQRILIAQNYETGQFAVRSARFRESTGRLITERVGGMDA